MFKLPLLKPFVKQTRNKGTSSLNRTAKFANCTVSCCLITDFKLNAYTPLRRNNKVDRVCESEMGLWLINFKADQICSE